MRNRNKGRNRKIQKRGKGTTQGTNHGAYEGKKER